MEFRNLKAQYNALKTKMDEAVISVMAGGRYIMGENVDKIEKKLSGYTGRGECITCANGTDALILSLQALGIGKGDAVFVPDFTFFATAEAVAAVGAAPVFVDVDKKTFNISPESLSKAVTEVKAFGELVPKAVIAVDLFGLPADYDLIAEIAESNGLYLIEDGAQGFGGEYKNRRCCSFGDVSTTSFFPAKPLGCYGDGGAVFTDDEQLAEIIRSLKVHGKGSGKYDNIRIGMNSRLDEIQAAVLLVKLEAFIKYELEAVNNAAREYNARLSGIVDTPYIPDGLFSSYAQYTVKFKSREIRDYVQSALNKNDIPCFVYYPRPLHAQQAFKGLRQYVGCDNSEYLCGTVLSLPIHPYIAPEDIQKICSVLSDENNQGGL